MHLLIQGTDGDYVIRDNDVRRVLNKGKKECTVYFNNKRDTPISINLPIQQFHEKYLGITFIQLIDTSKNIFLVRRKSIRRVHSDIAGNTTVCFSTARDNAIPISMSVTDFNAIHVEKTNTI